MAVGKVKKGGKPLKKGARKKVVDPFTKKDWYDIKAPSVFQKRLVGKTLVNRTVGNKIASECLKGRVFEVSLGDLGSTQDSAHRKFRLVVEDVQGNDCLTNFHGMSITGDKLNSLIRKKCTMIEAHTDARTTDGYLLRMFCVGFTEPEPNRRKTTVYASHKDIKAIRKIMVEKMQADIRSCSLRKLVQNLIPDSTASDISEATKAVRPMRDICIRKVKVIKKPKFDINRLKIMHEDSSDAKKAIDSTPKDHWGRDSFEEGVDDSAGVVMDEPAMYEPPILETV